MKKIIFTLIAFLNFNNLEACFSPDPKLGDSAYWAIQAIEFYAAEDYEKSISIVDECYDLYVPKAVEIQKLLTKIKKKQPPIGAVNASTKKKIQDNYLLNDVSMALWAKAKSLHKLERINEAKIAYSQCLYLTHGRAWDPGGWFWSPASDCIKTARRLLDD
jgi:tetratricopeptide (TPR) repeat protein